MTRLLNDFVGQDQALNLLRSAVANPVHAYVLYGPTGCGVVPASREFAASLVCEYGGCGECSDCVQAMRGIHPDVIVAMAEGPTYGVEYVKKSLGVWAMRQPLEAKRTVMVIPDADGMTALVAGAFLKMIEEPVASTIFVLLATTLPKQHITIWSRCAEIPFRLLSVEEVAQVLVNDGVDQEQARILAEGAGGDVSRARLFADDPGFAERLAWWRSVPERLDGTGAMVVTLVEEIEAMLAAVVEPLTVAHAEEIEELKEQAQMMGERGLPGGEAISKRHKRELRRIQSRELEAGLGALAGVYRHRMHEAMGYGAATADEAMHRAAAVSDAITKLRLSLVRNPRQNLALERLLLSLA